MHNELIVHNWGSRLSKGNVAMNTRRNAIAGFLAALFAGGGANDAPAQQPQSAAATGTLEEIVVTARRREENFQELPLSIAAITSDTMATMGITTSRTSTTSCRMSRFARRMAAARPHSSFAA